MATPTPHTKPTANKLPIKRRSPHQPQPPEPLQTLIPSSSSSDPDPNVSSTAIVVSAAAAAEDGYYDDDDADDEEENGVGGLGGGEAGARPPPFKFHRIWSEPDEIRFLQGLLGCFAQGLVFPRDLNVFFDRFAESTPQPYTRSQLSEKLRRLRRKYRAVSARIDAGRDPSRLAPHDRDLLHLSARLWHPSHAASSPFSSPAPDGVPNKRRRRSNPPSTPAVPLSVAPLSFSPVPVPAPVVPVPVALITAGVTVKEEESPLVQCSADATNFEEKKPAILPPHPPQPANTAAAVGGASWNRQLAGTVLDVFDGCLKEFQMTPGSGGAAQLEQQAGESDFARRWREQRLAELNVLARRLRLVIEDSL